MKAALKAEFLKLLTIRSTYFITGVALALVTVLSVLVFGYLQSALPADNPAFIADVIYTMLASFSTFSPLIAILLVTHEYRYNTINYTLTFTRSRLTVLFAKMVVVLTYATIIGMLVAAISYFGAHLGLRLDNQVLVPQEIPVWELVWRYSTYVWGYVLTGLIVAVLVRGIVGSIVALFMISPIEQLTTLFLKDNAKYLPIHSLDAIAATPNEFMASLNHGAALGVFCVYLLVFGSLAAISFVHYDAS